MNKQFLEAKPILKKLHKFGHEGYFVGGAVRDFLMGRTVHDVDIATSATPEKVKEIFKKTVDVGIEHGTVLVLYNGKSYEITTFRTEADYEDWRRPSIVNFTPSLEVDLQRRDFTMNAIAMTVEGEIIDPYSGQTAINNKVIATVGDADERFNEDALRLLRAVRFVSQLQFTVDENTKLSLLKNNHLLQKIAIERITAEFEKILNGPGIYEAIELLIETKLYKSLPGLLKSSSSLQLFLTYQLNRLSLIEKWVLLLFCYEVNDGKVRQFLKGWKMSRKQSLLIEKVFKTVQFRLNNEWSRRELYEAGRDVVEKVERLVSTINRHQQFETANILRQYDKLPIHCREELQVDGYKLMKWLNRQGGPWLAKLLEEIETAILKGDLINDEKAIKEWVEHWATKSANDC